MYAQQKLNTSEAEIDIRSISDYNGEYENLKSKMCNEKMKIQLSYKS